MKRRPLTLILLLGVLTLPLAGAATLATDLYLADVELRIDRSGRAVLLLDQIGQGEPGLVDTALIYEAQQPLPSMPPRHWRGAAIEETRTPHGRVIRIASASASPFLLRLEVADRPGSAPETRQIDERSADLRGGIALLAVGGRLLRDGGGKLEPLPTFAEAETEHLVTSIDRSVGGPETRGSACGSGASSCSVNCQGSFLGISIGDDCAIDCKEGYSACCECTGWLRESASCTCILDQKTGGDEFIPEIGGGDEIQ